MSPHSFWEYQEMNLIPLKILDRDNKIGNQILLGNDTYIINHFSNEIAKLTLGLLNLGY